MAKKKKTEDNTGTNLLVGLGAFLFGTAIAQPSKLEQQQLHQFKSDKYLYDYFKKNRYDFHKYLNERKLFEEYKAEQNRRNSRWESLGEFKINPNIQSQPEVDTCFRESVEAFLGGLNRNACISCGIVMEAILKTKFNKKKLVDLIEEAKANDLISNNDKNYLHAVRMDRNDYVHTLDQQVTENDAKVIILITARIINKILV